MTGQAYDGVVSNEYLSVDPLDKEMQPLRLSRILVPGSSSGLIRVFANIRQIAVHGRDRKSRCGAACLKFFNTTTTLPCFVLLIILNHYTMDSMLLYEQPKHQHLSSGCLTS